MDENVSTKKKIDIDLTKDDLRFRFTNFFDERSRSFEDCLVRSLGSAKYMVKDDNGDFKELLWPALSYWQSYRYLEFRKEPFFLLQMSNRNTNEHYQIAVQVEVSKISLFQIGIVQKWVMAADELKYRSQRELIQALVYFCRHHTSVMSLRIQPYMPGPELLGEVHKLLSPVGFGDRAPKAYIKTRLIDLRPSLEEMLGLFSANGRVRLRVKSKYADEAQVKTIVDSSVETHLQTALDDAYERSANKKCPYDFSPLFRSAERFCRDVVILGFYLRESFGIPRAFITGVSHCNIVEFSVGGSMSDSRLRKFPFNHVLMWQLVLRSKENGSHFLDMGGVSSGNEEEGLYGITQFKRSFPGFELFVGREMELALRPRRLWIYLCIQRCVSYLRKVKK